MSKARTIGAKDRLAASFMLHLGLALADTEKRTHVERAQLIATASNSGRVNLISNLEFVGSFQKLDLRGMTFFNCIFSNCGFVDCTVDESTIVSSCQFLGDISLGKASQIDAWKKVTASNNQADSTASVVVSLLLDSTTDRKRDLLMDVFSVALAKFWHSGRPRRTIDKENWKRGILAQSPMCDLVLQGFLSTNLLEEIEISGTKSGGYAIDPSAFSDVQKFIDSRALSGKVASAFDFCYERMPNLRGG